MYSNLSKLLTIVAVLVGLGMAIYNYSADSFLLKYRVYKEDTLTYMRLNSGEVVRFNHKNDIMTSEGEIVRPFINITTPNIRLAESVTKSVEGYNYLFEEVDRRLGKKATRYIEKSNEELVVDTSIFLTDEVDNIYDTYTSSIEFSGNPTFALFGDTIRVIYSTGCNVEIKSESNEFNTKYEQTTQQILFETDFQRQINISYSIKVECK